MLENLREFIKQIPVLAAILEREVLNHPSNTTNTEDLRHYVEGIQKQLFARMREERALYAVMHFPEHEMTCPLCKEELFGYYWEVNNAATSKGYIVANRLIHGLVAHEQLFLEEPMQTVGGTKVGDTRLMWDLAELKKTFEGANVSPEVMAELEEAMAMQRAQLEAAGAFVTAGGGH